MNTPSLRARRGFTIMEVMISMTLMLTVIGLSTQLFRRQSNAVADQSDRLGAQQNSRFAIGNLDRELRMAGGGVFNQQPMVVMAGATAITFNANLVALDTGDLAAVYINPDADSAGVDLLRTTNKITLPGTSKQYPDTNYLQNNVPSHAETISYWLSRDSTSKRSNEYILFRRANARPPRVVARGILYNSGDTVFQYYKGDSTGVLTPISSALLPLIHTAPIHGTQVDTGRSALTDSIRQVRVSFKSVYYDTRAKADRFRRVQMRVKLMNAGLIRFSTCGNAPLGVSPSASIDSSTSQPFVTITWTPSIDETTGEKDVERYAIYKRLASVPNFGEPFASVPAGLTGGATSYTFVDTEVVSGQSLVYGITSQDCTLEISSSMGTTAAQNIP